MYKKAQDRDDITRISIELKLMKVFKQTLPYRIFRGMIFFILITGSPSKSQNKVRIFTNIDFNKVEPGKVTDYLNLEGNLWKPVQQEHIKEGGLAGWNVFRVWFSGTASEYNYAVMELYDRYENMSFDYNDDILSKVHPGISEQKLMDDTYAAREIAFAQSAVRISTLRPHETQGPSKYVRVTYLNIKQSNEAQFEKNILEIAIPAMQERMENGYNQGWDLYKVVAPGGDSVPFQYISFEYLPDMGLMVKPGGADASKGMEPGKIYRTELWERIYNLGLF